jgi:acetoin utilization deacetylase AcuC-like enzyme
VLQREGLPATESELLRVHTTDHIARLKQAHAKAEADNQIVALDSETLMSPLSWRALLAATGCVLTTCEAVLNGEARNGFALARPPGHHATASTPMGFCLVNHVAIAARWLIERGMERVLIIDWDVHHGNGTQDIFYHDPAVYYLSLHQSPWYPGTGHRTERGGGDAHGMNRNVPLPAGTTGAEFVAGFKRELEATLSEFTPEFILVSAGFDCLRGDPLGQLLVAPSDLHVMTTHLMSVVPHGRIVHTLEGGYNPPLTGAGVVAVVRALTGLASR